MNQSQHNKTAYTGVSSCWSNHAKCSYYHQSTLSLCRSGHVKRSYYYPLCLQVSLTIRNLFITIYPVYRHPKHSDYYLSNLSPRWSGHPKRIYCYLSTLSPYKSSHMKSNDYHHIQCGLVKSAHLHSQFIDR